ncbi:MAG: carbon-nitrogen hydrolase family protein [Balneolaceae bacterium]|nr:carbon-nitrogen hydrolase family protein [Balneolaceae bacterium]
MKTLKVAALQMNSQPDLDYNLDQAYRLVRQAAFEGCRMACLPENFSWMARPEERAGRAAEIASRSRAFLRETSAEFDIWIAGGTYPEPDGAPGGLIFARSELVGPDGELRASYDKMHLFDVDLPGGESYRESDFIAPGQGGPTVSEDPETGAVGLSVCYDLRFPELYRALSDRGAQMLLVPSAFTRTTGQAHWHPLLRARAIENTCWVVAAAQHGRHGDNRHTFGHALIADPWGEISAEKPEGTGMAVAELDPVRLEEVRRALPSLKHRRL